MKYDEMTIVNEDEQPVPENTETIIQEKSEQAADVVNEDAPDIPDDEKIPDRAVLNDDGSWTLPLLFPRSIKVTKGGVTKEVEYRELRFYRLTGADMRAVMASKGDEDRVLMERSSRISAARMKALYNVLDAEDVADSQKICVTFFGRGRRTGR